MRQSAAFVKVAVTVSLVIAALVTIFWLREMDLTFLATYRAIVAPVVAIAGGIIGIGAGRWFRRSLEARRREGGAGWSARHAAAIALISWVATVSGLLYGMAGIATLVWAYWDASTQVPPHLPSLTRLLFFILLCAAFLGFGFSMYPTVVELRYRRGARADEAASGNPAR